MSSKIRFLRLALLSGAAAALVSVIDAGAAQAAPITYQLNTIISGNTLTPTTSFGTVTYSDNGTSVDVTIDLADHSNGVSKMTMNYNDTKFPISGYTWSVGGDANTIAATENGVQADGYTLGKFDINISKSGNGGLSGTEPYTFTISLKDTTWPYGSDYNLDPTDFAFSTTGGLYNAVLIDCDPIWVGSAVTPAPEPMSLALLGVGITALGFIRRRTV